MDVPCGEGVLRGSGLGGNEEVAKVKVEYACTACGFSSPKWLGKCPDCGQWGSLVEEGAAAGTNNPRAPRGFPSSATLIGGDPGIGKSTVLLQVASGLAREGRPVLYVSGEESEAQVKLRASRLGVRGEGIFLLAETSVERVIAATSELSPFVLIVDSIQTMFTSDLPGAPGSVGQVRECAGRLVFYGKKAGVSVFLVGHVTKEGTIAGPRVLEHLVDTVLYFEGEEGHPYRT